MVKAPHYSLVDKKWLPAAIGLAVLMALVSPSKADWRDDMGVFRIGVTADNDEPIKPARLEPFRAAIAKVLDMPVEIFQARDASTLIDAVASSRVEYAVLPAIGYATLDASCSCVLPLVAPRSELGATAVRSILIANTERIDTLSGLSAKKIAVGPDYALTTSLVPKVFFKVSGKSLAEAGAVAIQTKDQEEALKFFIAGEVDAFFAWEYVSEDSEKTFNNSFMQRIRQSTESATAILWSSDAFRYGPHLVRKNLPKGPTEALKKALLRLAEDAPLAYDAISPDLAGGFVGVEPGDYESALKLVKAIGSQSADSK